MAGALPLVDQNEKELVKFLRCPICFEFPKDKVFQCKKGHSLCSACYHGCSDCPFCGCRLDKNDPIRNFSLEEVLDNFVEVHCPYKVNGCGQRPKRGLIQAHQSKCHFNFEKFGKLINVCKLIGYKDCGFQFNNGSTEDAVKHYVSAHGCVVASANHFQMELTSLLEVGFNNECFWTPIISDLKNCFLLTFAIRNRNDGLTCVSLIMPKLNESCRQAPVMQYSFNVTTEEEPLKYGFHRSCMDLRKVESLLQNRLPFVLSNSKSHFTNGSLLIDCLVQGLRSCNETDKIKPERIVCCKITTSSEISSSAGFLRLNLTTTENVLGIELKNRSINTTYEARTFIDEAKKACLISRDALKVYILTAFTKTRDPAVLEYLKKMMSIMAAEFGSLESMKLCIENGINVNQAHLELGSSMSLLGYALKDKIKKVGFEKVKLLVENGADVHFKNALGCSLLHLSVSWSSDEAVKFFLEKGLQVNACNPGWTPLHAAFYFRKAAGYLTQKVKLLLDYGADVYIEDKDGRNAIYFMKKDLCNEEIVKTFLNRLHTVPNTTAEN